MPARLKPELRRLLFIDRAIRSRRYPNCASLAREYEVSSKTMQRTIDFIKEMGAPVAYDDKRHGYYYKEENYTLPNVYLDEQDMFAMFIADRALAAYRNTPLYSRLVKVFGKIRQYLSDKVTVKAAWTDPRMTFMAEPQARLDPEVWDTVAEALHSERQMEISYQGPRDRTPQSRTFDPYHMLYFRGQWYVIGHCHFRGMLRTFAVSRIRRVRILKDETYTIPDDFDVEKVMGDNFGVIYSSKTHAVRVRFSPEAAPYIAEREWHPTQKVTNGTDGSITLAMQVNDLLEVKHWILSWGADAEVLAPKELRDDIQQEIEKLLENYR